MSFMKKIEAASRSIVDNKAALECVDYILDSEADDYYEQAGHNGITKENWEKKWDKINHVYASALKAVGGTPDVEEFED